MTFDNEDAVQLATKFMDSRTEKLSDANYFVKFVEVYINFDKWLRAEDPIEAAQSTKKTLRLTP